MGHGEMTMEQVSDTRSVKQQRAYVLTKGEEIANAATHGAMAALVLLLLPFAAIWSYIYGDILAATSVSIFVISLFLMFLSSTLYHAMQPGTRYKAIFRRFDHICIYVTIAGGYTPIALLVIGGWQGMVILVLQWSMVVFGILFETLTRRIPKANLAVYLVMGWTMVFFFPILLAKANSALIVLFFAGGISYTAGAVIYALKRFRYHHMVWHLMINLAAAAHVTGIVFSYIPWVTTQLK